MLFFAWTQKFVLPLQRTTCNFMTHHIKFLYYEPIQNLIHALAVRPASATGRVLFGSGEDALIPLSTFLSGYYYVFRGLAGGEVFTCTVLIP